MPVLGLNSKKFRKLPIVIELEGIINLCVHILLIQNPGSSQKGHSIKARRYCNLIVV
jgi:hypothetical protein